MSILRLPSVSKFLFLYYQGLFFLFISGSGLVSGIVVWIRLELGGMWAEILKSPAYGMASLSS